MSSIWNDVARKYHEKFMNLSIYNDSYKSFLSHLNIAKANILDLGSGPGVISYNLNKLNNDLIIDVLDASENMINICHNNLKNLRNAYTCDCRDISSLTLQYDGIVIGFVIPYLNNIETQKLLSDCYHLLQDNGVLYISYIQKDSSYVAKQTSSDGLYTMDVYYYSHDDIRSFLFKSKFTIIEQFLVEYQLPNSSSESHAVFIVKK